MRSAIVVSVIAALHASALGAPNAEDLYNEGQAAFDSGDYASAIHRWQESYRLSKEPGLLFNLGQAYNLAVECEHALASYKQFIALDPTSDKRPLAEGFIRDLERKCGWSTVPHADQSPPQIENTTGSGRNLKVAGVVTGGAGTALVISGLLFGRRASALGNDVTRACAELTNPCNWTDLKDKDATGRRDSTIGYTFDAIGVAAIVGGAVVYYLGDRESRLTVSPRPREGGALVSWSGAW